MYITGLVFAVPFVAGMEDSDHPAFKEISGKIQSEIALATQTDPERCVDTRHQRLLACILTDRTIFIPSPSTTHRRTHA